FAYEQTRRGFPVISVNWDRWQGVGMGAVVEALHRVKTGQELTGGLHVSAALEAFDRIVGMNAPQVVVSVNDVERSQAEPLDVVTLARRMVPGALHPRPFLATAFVPPRNDVERQI